MSWTHSICDDCYATREPGRVPVKVRAVPGTREDGGESLRRCCYCLRKAATGAYYRSDPRDTPCAASGCDADA